MLRSAIRNRHDLHIHPADVLRRSVAQFVQRIFDRLDGLKIPPATSNVTG
jgi:hypothetical protein